MNQDSALLEIFRWGYVNMPGVLFAYSRELDLDMEDMGIMAAIIYAFEDSRPLNNTGIEIGHVLQVCPALSRQKLTRKLNAMVDKGLIEYLDKNKSFSERVISFAPLINRVKSLVIRDHPQLEPTKAVDAKKFEQLKDKLTAYEEKIEQLEHLLQEKNEVRQAPAQMNNRDRSFRMVADFIARKTGNLLSVKMSNELHVWLEDMGFSSEFLLVVLELCFERKITNPADISRINKDLKEYGISSLDGLELYFQKLDAGKIHSSRLQQYDPDIIEFGSFIGIDMNAEARKRMYYKWRYDWGFSHAMIMKAGEVMCQRTRTGGLEYIDSVLNNWMAKEIRQVQEAEKEIIDFKAKNRNEKKRQQRESSPVKKKRSNDEYEIYVPPVKK